MPSLRAEGGVSVSRRRAAPLTPACILQAVSGCPCQATSCHRHTFYKWKALFSFSWWGRKPEISVGAWRQSCFPSRDELVEMLRTRFSFKVRGRVGKAEEALAPFKIDDDAGLM